MQNAPYSSRRYICNFCDKGRNEFVYHCSCGLDFHIKCALFTFNITENNLKELEHVALQHPLISTENGHEELEDENGDEELKDQTALLQDMRRNQSEGCRICLRLLSLQVPFTCDACGIEGNHVAHRCANRSLQRRNSDVPSPAFRTWESRNGGVLPASVALKRCCFRPRPDDPTQTHSQRCVLGKRDISQSGPHVMHALQYGP
ncbi:hypothetical protein Goklo_015312 [Gossypium klotzschianum]|uniref:DC1 domain-containing protein n=1 Tax=Gossypium klotzschianum TaxID=34286 RepID=A0A7J8UAH8_9ROSI|nr:hypothetical protein [Gossypium klotzschianum]